MKNLDILVETIITGSNYNDLPIEERNLIRQFTKEQQILDLWQVLNWHKDLTNERWRAQLRSWLVNCVESYQREYK